MTVIAGVAFVSLITPSEAELATRGRLFSASHEVAPPPSATLGDPKPNQTRLEMLRAAKKLFRTPEVGRRAAEALDFEGEPAALASRVSVRVNKKVGTVVFTAQGRDRSEVAELVDTYASEAMDYQQEVAEEAREAAVERASEQVEALSAQLNDVEGQLKAGNVDNPALKARRDAIAAQLTAAATRQTELGLSGPTVARFETVSAAKPIPVSKEDENQGFGPPESRRGRLLLALPLAIALGSALALVLDRFDPRVNTRMTAEYAFGVPVLAEIPLRQWRHRRAFMVETAAEPDSPAAEGYRRLRSALLLSEATPRLRPVRSDAEAQAEDPPEHGPGQDLGLEPGKDAGGRDIKVILVTSPRRGDGRSTTVANLAVSLAEVGRSVLVVDCDLRRPSLAQLLGARRGPGLTDIVKDPFKSYRVADVARVTNNPMVRLLLSGAPTANPAALLTGVREVLLGCRTGTDILIIDTPPGLEFNDVAELAPLADAVVVVARAGRTTPEDAVRLGEMLARLGAPVFGVALIGVRGSRELIPSLARRGGTARMETPVPRGAAVTSSRVSPARRLRWPDLFGRAR